MCLITLHGIHKAVCSTCVKMSVVSIILLTYSLDFVGEFGGNKRTLEGEKYMTSISSFHLLILFFFKALLSLPFKLTNKALISHGETVIVILAPTQ